jgi:hypothetical protein
MEENHGDAEVWQTCMHVADRYYHFDDGYELCEQH